MLELVAPWRDDGAEGPRVLRVMAGPQDDRFTADALAALVSAPYRVTVQSDRIGYRLDGPRLSHRAGADIISDTAPMGSLQVPASGQPVLLMADHQTTGGYARIATVISADLGLAGQAAPGDLLQFTVCTREDAVTARRAREARLAAAEADRKSTRLNSSH